MAPADLVSASEPVVEMVADGVFDQPLRLGRGQPVLGLADEFRLADESTRPARRPPVIRSSRVIWADLFGCSPARRRP